MEKRIEVGMVLPGFSLADQNAKETRDKDFTGKKRLLSFHPLAWTSICSKQMQMLEENYDRFLSHGIVPIGFSVDHQPCKKAWAESLHIRRLQMLCDFWPHGAYAQMLGIFREANGFSERANIIVSAEGIVEFVKIYPIKELPNIEEILTYVTHSGGQ
jgi:peroxiredoxin